MKSNTKAKKKIEPKASAKTEAELVEVLEPAPPAPKTPEAPFDPKVERMVRIKPGSPRARHHLLGVGQFTRGAWYRVPIEVARQLAQARVFPDAAPGNDPGDLVFEVVRSPRDAEALDTVRDQKKRRRDAEVDAAKNRPGKRAADLPGGAFCPMVPG